MYGLKLERPGSSTGKNLMLSKFTETAAQLPYTLEVWDEADNSPRWTVCAGQVYNYAADGPDAIYTHLWSTSASSVSTKVRWTLSPDTDCFAGSEYTIGEKTWSNSALLPTFTYPAQYDFTSVPAGSYWVCAKVDPDAAVSEQSETDNTLRSETQLVVEGSCN